MPCGAPCADNTYRFLAVAIPVAVRDDQQCDAIDHAKRLPTLFAIDHPFGNNDMQRVVPNFLRQREGDTMLGDVRSRLARVSLELH